MQVLCVSGLSIIMSEPHALHIKLHEAPHNSLGPTMQPPTASRQRRCIPRTSYGGLFTHTHSRILARARTYSLLRGGPRASPEVRPQTNLRIQCLLSYSRVLHVYSLTPAPFSHLRFPRSPYIWLPPLAAPHPSRPPCFPYPTQFTS